METWFLDSYLHRAGDLPANIEYYETGQEKREEWFQHGLKKMTKWYLFI